MEWQAQNRARFEAAIRRFDEANGQDPHREVVDGVEQPRELLYSRWLTRWVLRLAPQASEELCLAARCQHLCRWMIPRESYPMTRSGYLRWREALKRFHAEKAGEVLREAAYPEQVIDRVQALNLKKEFPADPESRVLEDALCLVFLERQFGAMTRKTSEDKLLSAVKKVWQKMTPAAQALAKQLPYTYEERVLLEKALKRAEAGQGTGTLT